MSLARRLSLVVTRGFDIGARLVVDDQVRVVGRLRSADLPVADRSVSRKHLEVVAAGDSVVIRALPGTKPFLLGGRALDRAELRAGDSVVVGNTQLAVVESVEEPTLSRRDHEATDMAILLGGATADAHVFAAVFSLTEALDEARDRADVEREVAAWARRHVDASETHLQLTEAPADEEDDELLSRDGEIVARACPGGVDTIVSVPIHAGMSGAVVFRLPTARVSDPVRRLLLVAGRLCASSVSRLSLVRAMEEENASLRRLALGGADAFLGTSPAALQVARVIPRLAASDALVLLLGESGSGKTFVLRLIHEAGPRAREPLRVINCAAIPEALLESELFGHERGAFTGAVSARPGAFEAAGRGTVLLDEIGELPLTSQAKLLRVLEERRFERIGSNRAIPLQARVLAATNRDLQAMVEEGRFRRDLYFRISVVNLRIPPLRDRGEDVALLARQILADLAPTAGRRVTEISPAAMEVIRRYAWPGNVRELRNAIEHALVLGDGPVIEPSDLPDLVRGVPEPAADGDVVRLPARLDWLEDRAIDAALRATGGNRTRAAALLGINRATMYKKRGPEG